MAESEDAAEGRVSLPQLLPGEPGFDELPEWFRQEIEDRQTRCLVDRDAIRCRETRQRRWTVVCGAAAALVFGWGFLGPSASLALALFLAGGLASYLTVRLDLGAPLGILVHGLLIGPIGYRGAGPANIGFFLLAVAITGGIIAQTMESLRGLQRGA